MTIAGAALLVGYYSQYAPSRLARLKARIDYLDSRKPAFLRRSLSAPI
jgi:hypothetical protein